MSKITILSGHYGSGKTLIAVNMAVELKRKYPKVILADLDIVNPYFRSVHYKTRLDEAGIRLIASQYANTNVELPGFPPDSAAVFDDPEVHAVIDVGGDDRGALALGRFSERLKNAEMLMVINAYRPLTSTPEAVIEVMREIEAASRLKFTGLCNNSHWGTRTTAEIVRGSAGYANRVSEITGLPVKMTAADIRLKNELADVENLMTLEI